MNPKTILPPAASPSSGRGCAGAYGRHCKGGRRGGQGFTARPREIDLQTLEVTLRNAVDREMSRRYLGWLTGTAVLKSPELRQVGDARDRLTRQGKPHDHGRVVAELQFGFWTSVFANSYDTDLWRSALYRSLYPRQQRAVVHDMLDRLRTLRNRIAHHEPIIQRRLVDDHQRILDLLSWLNPATAAWVDRRSRVIDLLALPPTEITSF